MNHEGDVAGLKNEEDQKLFEIANFKQNFCGNLINLAKFVENKSEDVSQG